MAIDKDRFEQHVFKPESSLEIVLRGHLWVENLINQLLSIHIADGSTLDLDRMGFRQKIDIAQAFGFISGADGLAFRALNRIRNRLAHNLMAEPGEGEIRELVSLLAGHAKAVFDRVMQVPEVLEQADDKYFHLRYWFFSYATHLDYLCSITKYQKDNSTKLLQVAAVQYASEKYGGKKVTDEDARGQFDLAAPPSPDDIWR